MQSNEDIPLALTGTLVLHAVVLVALLVAGWIPPARDWRAPGPPVEATIQFTAADLEAAQAVAAAAPPPPPPAEVQPRPQAPLEDPDPEDQEEVVEVGPLPSEQTQVQEEQTRQAQVDLTEELERQRQAENRQRLQEQLDAIRREREEAAERTRMEEQRLAQLADRTPATPKPAAQPQPVRESGRGGEDAGLRARYIAALNATARDNWNTGLAPELTRCRVRFQQIPGGEVIDVEFMDCPYDAQGRESVERALLKTPMPYSGFESVFEPKITLTFCHPEEACQ